MKRRQFISLLGGAAAGWPLPAFAQQPAQVRRIGVLMNTAFDDPEGQARVAALMQELQESGWAVGRNLRVDLRWGAGDAQRLRAYADELVALGPDALLASGLTTAAPLAQATRTVPIVFVSVTDPVGSTIVESLARPGGNVTGFANFEFGISVKWIELLKELSPRLTRVGVLRDPVNPAVMGLLGSIQAVAPSLGVELRPIAVRDPSEIERAFDTFVQTSIGGVIVLTGGVAVVHRGSIIALAARHRLPAVYPFRYHVVDGGLISYGPNSLEQVRRAARYLDRVLKGEKPADLPVQAPTKYELVINLKTAKALGLDVPDTLLARADEVIE
jgi:putative ABC transport system substrate-binding protein